MTAPSPSPRGSAATASLAHPITTPSWCFTSLALAVAVQIGLTALTFGAGALWPVVAGLAVFAAVAGVQLLRFRRRNGVWLGGFASRVVLGTATPSSVAYAIALAAAIWAAYVRRRKGVDRGRRTTWIALTPRGRAALGAHVAALRELISGVD
jgi:hypothetical protein